MATAVPTGCLRTVFTAALPPFFASARLAPTPAMPPAFLARLAFLKASVASPNLALAADTIFLVLLMGVSPEGMMGTDLRA